MIERIRNFTHGKNSLRGASLLLITTLFLSNFLGVIRNYFLTRHIPVSSLDVYYAAFRLPDLAFNLLILGAIASAFIPVFTNYLHKDDEKTAWHIANSVLTIAVVSLICALIILYFLMPFLIHLVVPSFSISERLETVRIARLMLLSPFFFGVSYVLGGILNSFQRFVAYSLAPLAYNLSIIAGAAFLAPLFPRGDSRQLTVVAIAVVVGAFLHMVIQFPSVRHVGWHFRWIFDWRHQAVRKIGKLMIPRTIGLGANQIMLVAFTAIASAIPGAVSYFNLANDIQTMPTVVFGTSFATAVFPSLSAAVSREDKVGFSNYLTRTMNVVIALMIPFTVALILLRVGIVQVLLGFNLEHTITTANTLALFAVSLIASGLIPLFSRAFYALHDTRTPTIISIISIVISVLVALLFRSWGAPGLALGFSAGSFFNALFLYFSLRRRYPIIDERSLLATGAKVIAATLIMAVIIQLTKELSSHWLDVRSTRAGVFGQVIIAVTFGGLAYIGMAWSLGVKEVRSLWRRDIKD